LPSNTPAHPSPPGFFNTRVYSHTHRLLYLHWKDPELAKSLFRYIAVQCDTPTEAEFLRTALGLAPDAARLDDDDDDHMHTDDDDNTDNDDDDDGGEDDETTSMSSSSDDGGDGDASDSSSIEDVTPGE